MVRLVNRRKIKGMTGYVYLLKCGDQYKIGRSTDPLKRRRQLRTGSPYPFVLIHLIRSEFYRLVEKRLHDKFAGKRGQGEWFRLSDEDIAYIKSLNHRGRCPEEHERAERKKAARIAAYGIILPAG